MHEQQLEVGGVAHLAASELAQTADCEHAGRLSPQVFRADLHGFIDHHFGDARHRLRKIHQGYLRLQQMFCIDQKHMLVFESIEGSLLLFKSRGLIETRAKLAAQRPKLRFGEILQNREQILEMNI